MPSPHHGDTLIHAHTKGRPGSYHRDTTVHGQSYYGRTFPPILGPTTTLWNEHFIFGPYFVEDLDTGATDWMCATHSKKRGAISSALVGKGLSVSRAHGSNTKQKAHLGR